MKYGDLLNALSDESIWTDPDHAVSSVPIEWLEQFEGNSDTSFLISWRNTVQEMRDLLEIAENSLGRAALADDEKTLNELGCFDPKRNGSGTITAAAAIYLASRFSVRPSMGLLRSAFLANADTDTLASMTGALLGALHGPEWLSGLSGELQDRSYIELVSQWLSSDHSELSTEAPQGTASPASWMDSLISTGEATALYDGRPVHSVVSARIRSNDSLTVTRYKLVTTDGQSLIIDHTVRNKKRDGQPKVREGAEPESVKPSEQRAELSARRQPSRATRVAIYVSSLARAKWFYGEVLGIDVGGTDQVFYISPWIAVLQKAEETSTSHGSAVQITVATPDPEYILAKVEKHGIRVVPRGPRDIPGSLRVLDPDGHEVLVWPSHDPRAE